MKFVVGTIRLIIALGTLVLSGVAVLALLGFAVPEFDLFNHFQFLIFMGAVIAVIVVLLSFGKSRWKGWMIGAAAVGLLASAITFVPEFAFGLMPRDPLPTDERPVLKLMQHNLFGLNYDMARVNAVIDAEDPDIITLQEYFGEQSGALDPLLKQKYPYSAQCRGGKRANIAIYSKLPFEEAEPDGACPNDAYGTQRTARILATFTQPDGTRFSVLTTHLDWPVPVSRQLAEFEELTEAVKAAKGPLIVVGDFNSTPWSYALRDFAMRTMLDRQTRNIVTFPLRFTVPRRLDADGLMDTLPVLPLDHVLTRGGIAVHELHAGAETGSDHIPVIFTFSVLPERLRPDCCKAE
jgi:endonuclease/exonuclease/phosphatase (EEP) superfamily protein YafD